MYNFKSTLLILLLGIVLIIPAVYCFSLFSPSFDNKEKVDEGQADAPQVIATIDEVPPIAMNDTTKDSSISDDGITKVTTTDVGVTSEDSSLDGDDTTKDPSTNANVIPVDSSTDDNDTTKDSSTNGSEPSSKETDMNSWPVIMIMEDNSALVDAKSESTSRRVDSSNNWLVINKRTSIRRVEEETHDLGKNRKVLTEDKNEELRIYRDTFHTVFKNRIDLTKMLSL